MKVFGHFLYLPVRLYGPMLLAMLSLSCLEKTAGTSSETEVGDIAVVIESVDGNGAVVPYGQVSLKPEDPSGISYSGKADSSGRIVFDRIPAGNYTLLNFGDSLGSLQKLALRTEDSLIVDTLFEYGAIEGQVDPDLLLPGNNISVFIPILDREVLVNEDGSFFLEKLPEYIYQLEIETQLPIPELPDSVEVDVPRATVVPLWLGARVNQELERLISLFNGFSNTIGLATSDGSIQDLENGLRLTGNVSLSFPFGQIDFEQASLTVLVDSMGNFQKIEGVATVPNFSKLARINNPIEFTGYLKTGIQLNESGEIPFSLNHLHYFLWVESVNPISLTLDSNSYSLSPSLSVPFKMLQGLDEELLYIEADFDPLGAKGAFAYAPQNGIPFEPELNIPLRGSPLSGSRYYHGSYLLWDSNYEASGNLTIRNMDGTPVHGDIYPLPQLGQIAGFEGQINLNIPIYGVGPLYFDSLKIAGYWERSQTSETLDLYLNNGFSSKWPMGYSIRPTDIEGSFSLNNNSDTSYFRPQIKISGKGVLDFPGGTLPFEGNINMEYDSISFQGNLFQEKFASFTGRMDYDSTVVFLNIDSDVVQLFQQSIKARVSEGLATVDSLTNRLNELSGLFEDALTLEGIREDAASWASSIKSTIETEAYKRGNEEVDAHWPSGAPTSYKPTVKKQVAKDIEGELKIHLADLNNLIRLAESPLKTREFLQSLQSQLIDISKDETITISGKVNGSFCAQYIIVCVKTINYTVNYSYTATVFSSSQRAELARGAELVDEALELLDLLETVGIDLEELQDVQWDEVNTSGEDFPQLEFVRIALPHPGEAGFSDSSHANLDFKIGSGQFNASIKLLEVDSLLNLLGEKTLTLPEFSAIVEGL